MKRMRNITGCMLVGLLMAACEESLPTFEVTTVSIGTEWKDGDLHLTSDMKLSSGVEIIERGFVLELPMWLGSSWHDYEGSREKRTVRVEADADVSYVLLGEGWEPGLKCLAYAYVKTNEGNFRSDVEELVTEEPETPVFAELVHQPSELGSYYGGGKLVIEGSGFPSSKEYVDVYLTGVPLDIEEADTGRIVASYPAGQWGKVGEYEVKVEIGIRQYVLKQKMEIEGIRILSIEPERPRHGELVKMYLENFTPGSIQYFTTTASEDPVILEETEAYITFLAPEYPLGNYTFQIADRRNIWTEGFYVKMSPSWQSMDVERAGLADVTLGRNWWGFQHGKNYTWHNGKTYVLDYVHSQLLVFDASAGSWTKIALPEFNAPEWNLNNTQLFGWENSLYLFIVLSYNDDVEYRYLRRQYLCHLDLTSGQWLQVQEVGEDVLMGDNLSAAATQDGVAYASAHDSDTNNYVLKEYHLAEGVWKDSEVDLPAFATIVGSRGSCIYYHDVGGDGAVYGMDMRGGRQPWMVMPEYYNKKSLVVAGEYLYYLDGYAVCRRLLDVPGASEERMGPPFMGLLLYNLSEGFGVPLHTEDVPWFIWQTPTQGLTLHRYLMPE